MISRHNSNKKFSIILIVSVGIMMGIISCGNIDNPQNFITTTTQGSITYYDWANNWLKGIPCKAPCFEGITPGVTKVNTAFNNLNGYSHVKDVRKVTYYQVPQHTLLWKWYNNNSSNEAYYETGDEIIYAIQPALPKIEFAKVIAFYGEPDKIATRTDLGDGSYKSKFIYSFSIVYNEGLLLSYSSVGIPPTLSSSLELVNPFFYAPQREAEYNANFQISNWQGMKDFYFYCTDKKFCRSSVEQN